MHSPMRHSTSNQRRQPVRGTAGFTIVEVMLAAIVMVLGITTSITALQYGLRSVDNARNMTLAGQIMQSEMEILRLQNWTQINDLTGTTTVNAADSITTGTSTTLDATLTAIANRFTCIRAVENITGRADIKKITLTVTWSGIDGRSHTMKFQTRYAKDGLSDYFYTAH